MSDTPLLSFAILAFNQERYIRDAVRSAFLQTYSPLEIILSDDCSPDATFQIIESMSSQYSGPHRLILNRNSKQRGLGGHIDRVMELASGELIILAAGDDISYSCRTRTLLDAWNCSGREATSLYSDYVTISANSVLDNLVQPPAPPSVKMLRRKVDLASFVSALSPNVYGCTHAFVPKLYSFFGPLTDQVTYEDMALAFRSHAIGSLLHVQTPLIWYRRHEDNLSFHGADKLASDSASFARLEQKERRRLPGFIRGHDRFMHDLNTLFSQGAANATEADRVRDAIAKSKQNLELKLTLMEGNFFQRISALWRAKRNGCNLMQFIAMAARCLPRPVYSFMRIAKNRLQEPRGAKVL